MSNFEKFKEQFNEKFESIYDFIELTEERNPEIHKYFPGRLAVDVKNYKMYKM